MQQLKTGGIVILLLWAASECFNNEQSGREIWNVRLLCDIIVRVPSPCPYALL